MAISHTAAENPQQRVFRLPELRAEIFVHLCRRSLYVAAHVNRAWAATAMPLLWRHPPPKALDHVPAKRCHVYNAAIRHAVVKVGMKRQMKKAWTLPRLRELTLIYPHVPGDEPHAMQAFLSQYAAQLSRVTIWCENQRHGVPPYPCPRCDALIASEALVQHIARCRGLVGLTLGRLLTGVAVQSLHANVADPFWRLRQLDVRVAPGAIPTLCRLIRDVTDLRLYVAPGVGTGVLSAVSRVSNLRALSIAGCWGRGYEDLSVLGRLAHLQSLEIQSMAFEGVSDTIFVALLTQLPRLRSLRMPYTRGLSTAAYRIAASNCPELRHLALLPNLGLPSLEGSPSGPHYPELEELDVRDVEVDGGFDW